MLLSYTNYKYEDSDHPSAPSEIGHEHYTYDANGNPTRVENDSTAAVREMYWDEDNRLMVLSDNGKTSRYTYNHAGERAVKSHGSMEGVYINGAPQGITLSGVDFRLRLCKSSKLVCSRLALKFHETDEYTLYPASIISVNKNRYTKHYFIGDKRIASRIGSGSFNNVYGQNGSFLTAGQQDYAERLNQIETQREDYYRELGIAPGIPTMKGSYGDPENTGVGYNTIIKELGDHTVPAEWAQYVKHNTEADTAPGAPIQWDDPSDPESALPGYGFVADNSGEPEETFYYHSDHLGSTSYITDKDGNITQYDAYLPYGELLVDEHSSSEDLPYKFNGKELDEETGLYYYGARYMNPVTSIWYGVDPLTEKYTEISGYVYCHANPIRLIDPDGMDDYKMDDNGHLSFWRRTNAKTTDRVYKGKNNITISKNITQQLIKNSDSNGTSATTFNADDAFKFFIFAADNSNVEWNLTGVRKESRDLFLIGTNYSEESVDRNNNESIYRNMIFRIHSHPKNSNEVGGTKASGNYQMYKRCISGKEYENVYFNGDVWTLNNVYIIYQQHHPNMSTDNYPKAWIYYAGDKSQQKQLYQYNLNSPKFNVRYNPDYNQIRRKVYGK